MRVLVTGHHGYIGSVLAPMLQDAGHDVVGLDTFFYRGCDFGEAEDSAPHSRGTFVTSPPELEGFDAVVHLAALSNDPRGPRIGPTIGQSRRDDCTGARCQERRRRAVRLRVLLQHVRRRRRRYAVDEDAALRPLPRMRNRRYARRRLCTSLRETASRPSRCGMRPRTAPHRVCGSTSCSTISSRGRTRRVRSKLLSDGSSWRPLVHIRDIARATLPSSTHPAGPWQERRSTSAAPSRTTGFATWRRRSSGGCPTARSRSQKTPHPTHAATASTSPSSRHRSPTAASSGRRSEASTSSLTLIPGRS